MLCDHSRKPTNPITYSVTYIVFYFYALFDGEHSPTMTNRSEGETAHGVNREPQPANLSNAVMQNREGVPPSKSIGAAFDY